MAIFHKTITIPAGGTMPSLGALLGTNEYRAPTCDEKGDPIEHPNFFGEERSKMLEEFNQKVVYPQQRSDDFVRDVLKHRKKHGE